MDFVTGCRHDNSTTLNLTRICPKLLQGLIGRLSGRNCRYLLSVGCIEYEVNLNKRLPSGVCLTPQLCALCTR